MRKKTTTAKVSSKIQNVIKIAINHESKRRRRRQLRRQAEQQAKQSFSVLRPVINVSTGRNDDVSKILSQVSTERAVAELGNRVDQLISHPLFKSVLPIPSLTLGEVSRGLTRPLDDPSRVLTHTGTGEQDDNNPPTTPPPQEPPAPKSAKKRPFFSLSSLSLSPLTTPTSPQGILWGEKNEETPATATDNKVQELREYLIIHRSSIPRKKEYTIEDINRLTNINHIKDLYRETKKVVNSGGGGASYGGGGSSFI